MDPTVLGSKLASALVGPLVKKLFVQEGPGAGLVDRPVRLSALVSFKGEKRTLTEKDVRKLAARLVGDAVRSPGERPFPADEEEAVAHALADKLLALGTLDMDDVQAVRLGYRELARKLHGAAPASGLSADASFFLDSLTEWACLHVIDFFTRRSTFVAHTLVEQSRAQAELIAKLDELISRSPRPFARDAVFERRYLKYVAKRQGHLTIYGIDLVNSPAKWPLDVAYLSLEVTGARARREDFDTERQWDRAGAGQPIEVTNLIAAGVGPLETLPADQVLAEHDRVLLRGVAGSGKTTLVQWLAVSATRAEPQGPMAYLYGRVPLVLPLRTLTRHGERLPAPDDFLKASGCSLAAAQPEGWTDRVLEAGRGLVLIDGIDEVPETERERARAWLGELITAYPDNRWLVTSRPSAVRDDWLTDEGFTEVTLSAMSPTDVAAFIGRWHRAARTGTEEDDDADLLSYESQLLAAIRGKADLGRLATNPLMCGLICALHRDRRGYLPHGRKELYDAALTMLLTRRDRERDVATGVELQQEPQTQLLQRLAYWLIRNGRTELDRERAEAIIAEALPAVPAAAAIGDAAAVHRHLLNRSGLLREPAPGAVDFIHRTFQDYLGARAAVEVWDIGLLIEHAADDQWEDVIRMAVAHARPRERAEILTGLVEKGDASEEGRERNRIYLVAAACLEHAAELDPEVRSTVEARAATLVPPRDADAATELAAVGPLVLDLLPDPDGLDEMDAFYSVITATRLGTEAAIPYLAKFSGDGTFLARTQLMYGWGSFDAWLYAREVLARVDPRVVPFVVSSSAQLRALRSLGGRPMVMFRGDIPVDELAEYITAFPPEALNINDHPALTHVSFLENAAQLTQLGIRDCPEMRDLSAIVGLGLTSLDLSSLGSDADLCALATLDHLSELTLTLSPADRWDLGLLPTQAPLSRLVLNGRSRPEGGLDGLPRLRHLTDLLLNNASSPSHPSDWSDIASLPKLTHLRLGIGSLASAPSVLSMPSVVNLTLTSNTFGPPNLERIPSLFPGLAQLGIADGALREGLDLTALSRLPELRSLVLPDGDTPVPGLDQLQNVAVTTIGR
ncbi:NACHT domain-containing protein [Streptomyces olivochromogenes]|uniref:NACHT domain-containing protein n=1 Tax=Streptomyces olivochromogenes TaxID=1963 RepID=UPI001F3EA63C|nr:NACHT domain-containing protein [Streptomyces olivochromogenes]MCF3136047.1 NACHT domain-containing protein [Streptomyces olivochromogenes]